MNKQEQLNRATAAAWESYQLLCLGWGGSAPNLDALPFKEQSRGFWA